MTEVPGWFVIVNPAAGRGAGAGYWRKVSAELAIHGVRFEAVTTHGPATGRALAADAWRKGHRRFLALGGDGSLHDLVNGLGDCGPEALAGSTVGIAPCGTGNDWARGRRIPRRPSDLAALVASGRTAAHDLGALHFQGSHSPPVLYINVAGAGLDAHVSARISRRLPGAIAYPWATLMGLGSFVPPVFRINAGSQDWQGPQLVVFAAIGSHCGGGMHVAPGADPADGLADVIAIDALSAAGILRRLPKLFDGRLRGDAAVRNVLAARTSIEASPPCAVEADGQVVGTTPVEVVIHRHAIRVLAPVAASGSGP